MVGNNSGDGNSNGDDKGMTVESLPVLRVASDSSRMVVPRSAWAQTLVVDHMLGRGLRPIAAAPLIHDAPAVAHVPAAAPSVHDAPAPAASSWAQTLMVDHMLDLFPPALVAHMHLSALQAGQHLDLLRAFPPFLDASALGLLGSHTAALQPAGAGTAGNMAAATAAPFAPGGLPGLGPNTAALQPFGAGTAGDTAGGGIAAATAIPFPAAAWAGLEGQAAAVLLPPGAATAGDMAGRGMAAATATPFPGGADARMLQRRSSDVTTFGAGADTHTLQGRSGQAVQAEHGSEGGDGGGKEGDREEQEGVYIFGQLISPPTQ
ncbi:unnamed protein product [Closterium sp. Yama58-4]|nr:unnamed protein product [Closterium sp. Yama58-4]